MESIKGNNRRKIEHAICEELKKMFAVRSLVSVWVELEREYGIKDYARKTKELFPDG